MNYKETSTPRVFKDENGKLLYLKEKEEFHKNYFGNDVRIRTGELIPLEYIEVIELKE